MKKLSESFIDDVIRRSKGGEEREEDKIHWVDFGDFYIADRLYEKDGNIYFTHEEAINMFPEGEEIGLLDEETCEKLVVGGDLNDKSVNIWAKNRPENTINLPLSGANDIPQSKTQTIIWIYGISERYPNENFRCCVFNPKRIVSKDVLVNDISKTARVAILLMKKKKMNESFIDDVIRRSKGGEEREEDKIHWVDFGDFYIADRLYEDDKDNINFSYFDTMKMFPEGEEIGLMDKNILKKIKCQTSDDFLIISGENGKSIEIPYVGNNNTEPTPGFLYTWIYGKDGGYQRGEVGIFRIRDRVTRGACDIYTHKLPILLMKKKKMNESFIDDVIRRSRGNEKREEDKSPFDKGFEIIKNTEFVKIGDQYWCPFNFGSDSMDKPGDYLSPKQIRNLYEYLENTEYRVVEYDDWWEAYSFMKKPRIEKDSDGHTFYNNVVDGVEFNIYNFGYISQDKDEVEYDNIIKFGDLNDGLVGFTKVSYQRYFFLRHTINDESTMKVQIRIMKK